MAFSLRSDRRGLADRRQRIAQLVRERRQELVLAPVGLDQIALLLLAPRDVGEPDREVAVERRRDDVEPGVVAVGLGLAFHLAHFVGLERLDVHARSARVVPGARHDVEHRAGRRYSPGCTRMTLAAAVLT